MYFIIYREHVAVHLSRHFLFNFVRSIITPQKMHRNRLPHKIIIQWNSFFRPCKRTINFTDIFNNEYSIVNVNNKTKNALQSEHIYEKLEHGKTDRQT